MVAVVDSCHFPFVSLFLDVIHIWCLNDMQANNQIKGFGGGEYSLPSCHMRLPTSFSYFQEACKRQNLPKKCNFHVTNMYFLLPYTHLHNHEGL